MYAALGVAAGTFGSSMASSVKDHYANHLGAVYAWMIGDMDAAFSRSDAELAALSPRSSGARTAVDLGAGFGLHAIPLARRGFSVVAIDGCETLLQELAARAGALPIRAVNGDLLGFRAHIETPADVIVCMGDTLTHLPDHSSVAVLLREVAASLSRGGLFAATFRDYFSAPLQGDARFIPVHGDDRRIMTCFLEYGESTVTVHDLLHEREGTKWRLRTSSHRKLRLSPMWVAEQLSSLGLTVRSDVAPNGMIRISARNASP
jgi:2-polyprenyl-3-methyl-5-hydroxy-6-metoxy-1,4-benzoquinol methylase